ncbi:MAG: hypothetical protein HY716_14625 [Planctomycetes bacterium]|nr:hypothetical protein [Planctomycetota bacterium]
MNAVVIRLFPLGRLALPILVLLHSAGCDSKPSSASKGETAALPAAGAAAFDPLAYARQLLAEAGYPKGKDFPKLEILYNTDEGHKKIAAAIQQMWRQNLGIDVELRNSEWKVYLDDMSQLRYQVMRRGWIGDYRDPNTFIEVMTSASGNNNTGWANADYDRLVKEAGAEPDRRKRLELFRQAEEILMRELPVMPIYFYVSSCAWKDSVKGVYPNIQDIHPLNEAYVEGKDTLVINNAAEIQTLDPALARGVPEHRVNLCVFEGLTNYDPKTLDPRPGVAERWEISPDGTKYTFHLRDCAWSDGKKVTANDFVYAWRRVLNPATPTDYAHQLYYIKGAEAYNTKKTDDPSTIGVRAKDDRTLEVELENPCAFFLDLCAFYTYYPVRQDVIDKHGTNWTREQNFVCNGPFKLKEWRAAESIMLEKNPAYWNAERVKQKYVKFLPIDNRSTAWNLYLEGACDWVTTLPLDQIEDIIKRPDYRGDTYLGTYYYSFNVTKGPLMDRRIRKALVLAIDREIVVSKITRQGQKPAYHFTPPIFPEYKSPRFDVRD